MSNLDAALRGTMRLEISELHQQLGKTMIYVTHDQVEAMTMADKIVVLNAGNVEQVGSPLELYRNAEEHASSRASSARPTMNFVDGAEAATPRLQDHRRAARAYRASRPTPIDGVWKGTVGVAEHLGADTFLHVDAGELGTINVRASGEVPVHHGDTVWLTPGPGQDPPLRRRRTGDLNATRRASPP